LLFAQVNSDGANAEMFRRVNDQAAPATTDIEHSLTWPQTQFAADVIQFALLRSIDRVARRLKVGARINHPLIEPKSKKVVRQIVMKSRDVAVAFGRMRCNRKNHRGGSAES
jgi:hypothetical protein